ncbi:unnamed protein product [Chrysoparadoxa australica]
MFKTSNRKGSLNEVGRNTPKELSSPIGNTGSFNNTAQSPTGAQPEETLPTPSYKPPVKPKPVSPLDEEPESIVGPTLSIKGELEFKRLLRVDGNFDGVLTTESGSLIVGPGGNVKGETITVKQVLVEGSITANLCVEKCVLKGTATVTGDITCDSITIDPTVRVRGRLDVKE